MHKQPFKYFHRHPRGNAQRCLNSGDPGSAALPRIIAGCPLKAGITGL
jgi:hypothetical protein